MRIGAVFPQTEIGTDVGALRAYGQRVEELGFEHILAYDHVLGADPDRPGGFKGAYDKDVRFHEPFTFLAFAAAVTLYPALWRFAGLAVVLGVGAITAPLEHRRRDHTAHTAFVGS
jgi:hypothetical protein